MTGYSDIGIKIASALLKHRGKISIDEIEAIPFINKSEIDVVINELIKNFNVEIITQKKKSYPFSEWVKIIKIRK